MAAWEHEVVYLLPIIGFSDASWMRESIVALNSVHLHVRQVTARIMCIIICIQYITTCRCIIYTKGLELSSIFFLFHCSRCPLPNYRFSSSQICSLYFKHCVRFPRFDRALFSAWFSDGKIAASESRARDSLRRIDLLRTSKRKEARLRSNCSRRRRFEKLQCSH